MKVSLKIDDYPSYACKQGIEIFLRKLIFIFIIIIFCYLLLLVMYGDYYLPNCLPLLYTGCVYLAAGID